MKPLFLLSIVLLIHACTNTKINQLTYTDYVDPFIGTDGHGHTYPGPTLPFGMIQLGPDTRIEGWDGCSGYHYSDTLVYGFSHTHLSGTGVGDYNDLLIMPFAYASSIDSPYTSFASSFDKENEKARPGYYETYLSRDQIQVQLTTTQRCAYHRYIFKSGERRQILINLEHRDQLLDGNIHQLDSSSLAGFRISKAWAEEQHFYYYLNVSSPIDQISYRKDSLGRQIQAILTLPNSIDTIDIKVAMSFVDETGAKKNFDLEIENKTFEEVYFQANETWTKALSKVQVTDGHLTRKRIFYTALYHSFLAPNVASDVDGRYRGTDLQIHQDKKSSHYTIFSLWDTFRGTHPLFTLLQQQRTGQFIQTFLKQYQQGGQLPVWELASNYTGCMIGYHSVSVIQDAFIKGIDSFDHQLALNAMVHSADLEHLGLSTYKKRGFMTCDEEPESVSKNLEYAYDDWCIAQFAKAIGQFDVHDRFIKRAQAYKHLFDPSSIFLKGRIHGGWFHPFNPAEVNFNYTEANGWQYNFFVPHDIRGHVDLMGGEEIYDIMLDSFFETQSQLAGRHQVDITGLYGQYAHGNEPSHHCAYLYNYIGKPWKTQQRVRYVLDSMYTDQPDGLSGNEDCGQMSSWYNLSALGFYAVLPGSDQYVIGTPLFDMACLQLENNKQFCIETQKSSPNAFYIQQVSLNGKNYPKSYLTHSDIMNGGTLLVELGSKPNKDWGKEPSSRPSSSIDSSPILPSPVFKESQPTFWDSLYVDLSCAKQDVNIYYTKDGRQPTSKSTKLTSGFWIYDDQWIKAIAIDTITGQSSPLIEQQYLKVQNDKQIDIRSSYANQYSAGGDRALIDQLRGGVNFRTGAWQGYQDDAECIIDLLQSRVVQSISVGCLQDIKSWIWLPQKVDIWSSEDGTNFELVTTLKHNEAQNRYGAFKKELSCEQPLKKPTRYLKIKAKNLGHCPKWHLGAGGKAWVFLDEITIDID